MRLLSWIVYNACFDIRDEHGGFLVPRDVFRRVVRIQIYDEGD